MLRLAIARNLQILPKNLAAFTSNAINGLSNRLNQTASVAINHRLFSLSTIRLCEAQAGDGDGENVVEQNDGLDPSLLTKRNYAPRADRKYKRIIGSDRDRTIPVPYETSIEYLKSSAYKTTYGNEPVWVTYRRIHKGQLPKYRTRKDCITSYHKYRLVWTSSPCPICRDKYLVLHETNVDLLKQFISPYTGEVSSFLFIILIVYNVENIYFFRFYHFRRPIYARLSISSYKYVWNVLLILDYWS